MRDSRAGELGLGPTTVKPTQGELRTGSRWMMEPGDAPPTREGCDTPPTPTPPAWVGMEVSGQRRLPPRCMLNYPHVIISSHRK